MPRVAERMTEKRLRSLTKGCSCGVVPGLEVRVRTLGDGSTAKYFLLRDRATGTVGDNAVIPRGRSVAGGELFLQVS